MSAGTAALGLHLSNRECERLGVRREVGDEFETDQLDLFVTRFRVVAVSVTGVRVRRVSWRRPSPPPPVSPERPPPRRSISGTRRRG